MSTATEKESGVFKNTFLPTGLFVKSEAPPVEKPPEKTDKERLADAVKEAGESLSENAKKVISALATKHAIKAEDLLGKLKEVEVENLKAEDDKK